MAWLSFIELDRAMIHVIRLASFLSLWFQCVCPLMPSWKTYHLTCVSLTLDEGYLLMATPPDLEHGVAPLSPPAPTRRLRNHIVQPFISHSRAHGLEDPTNCSILSSPLSLSPTPPPHPANSATHLRGREALRRMQLGGTPPLPLEAVTSVTPRR